MNPPAPAYDSLTLEDWATMNDSEIGRRIGRAVESVRIYRSRHDLPTNPYVTGSCHEINAQRVLAVLQAYAGIPLKVQDVAEEMNCGRDKARRLLTRLKSQGRIVSWPDPNSATGVLYAAKAEEEEAA